MILRYQNRFLEDTGRLFLNSLLLGFGICKAAEGWCVHCINWCTSYSPVPWPSISRVRERVHSRSRPRENPRETPSMREISNTEGYLQGNLRGKLQGYSTHAVQSNFAPVVRLRVHFGFGYF